MDTSLLQGLLQGNSNKQCNLECALVWMRFSSILNRNITTQSCGWNADLWSTLSNSSKFCKVFLQGCLLNQFRIYLRYPFCYLSREGYRLDSKKPKLCWMHQYLKFYQYIYASLNPISKSQLIRPQSTSISHPCWKPLPYRPHSFLDRKEAFYCLDP